MKPEINKVVFFGTLDVKNMGIIEDLAMNQCDVAFNYFDIEETIIAEFVDKLKNYRTDVMAFCVPLDDFSEIENMVSKVIERWGTIDILINACDSKVTQRFIEMDPNFFTDIINKNITSIYTCTKHVLKNMVLRKKGKIFNISSDLGQKNNETGKTVYTAARAGIIGFTQSLSKEVQRYGISTNIIMVNIREEKEADIAVLIKNFSPNGNFITPVSNYICNLCINNYPINGQIIYAGYDRA